MTFEDLPDDFCGVVRFTYETTWLSGEPRTCTGILTVGEVNHQSGACECCGCGAQVAIEILADYTEQAKIVRAQHAREGDGS